MHKKIMQRCSKALSKDANNYKDKAKKADSPIKKKHEKIEMKEAKSAASDLKKRAKKSHEY